MRMAKSKVYFPLLALLAAGLLCTCESSDSSDLASFPLEKARKTVPFWRSLNLPETARLWLSS
jgi:hypothetical protein